MPPPSQQSIDEKERKHWATFWDEVPGWAKAALVGLGSWAASQQFAGSFASASAKEIDAQIRDLQMNKVRVETSLDAVRQQLDRIERKLDQRRIGNDSSRQGN